MKLLYLSAISLLLSNLAVAQGVLPQIYLENWPESRICAYSENKLPAELTGEFKSGNKFTVEVMESSSNKLIASYEATYLYGSFYFNVEEDIPPVEGWQVNYRVSSSNPKVQSNVLAHRRFFNRGTLSIQNSAVDTLNAGSVWPFVFNTTTNSPIRLTLSDSSQIEIPNSYSGFSLPIPATRSKEIFIVRAQNSCNVAVPSSGSTSVNVNTISIIPGKINNPAVCDGGEIKLAYSTSGGTIPATAVFKMRFLRQNYSAPDENRIFEIPAVKLRDGLLSGKIPEQMIRYVSNYQVAVLVDNPRLVSPYSEIFSIYEKPVATFRSQNDFARIGEPYQLRFDVRGPKPSALELSNGVSYYIDPNLLIAVYPENTTTFEIRSLTTSCGVTTDLPEQKVIISVAPGIAILPFAEV